jgi:hypothetical protein
MVSGVMTVFPSLISERMVSTSWWALL